jgi:small subunit ribosomal protein S4
MVNGGVVNVPSFQLKPGDIVSVRPRSRDVEPIRESLRGSRRQYSWLEVDRREMTGKFLEYPNREDIPENIREQLIVELYSK